MPPIKRKVVALVPSGTLIQPLRKDKHTKGSSFKLAVGLTVEMHWTRVRRETRVGPATGHIFFYINKWKINKVTHFQQLNVSKVPLERQQLVRQLKCYHFSVAPMSSVLPWLVQLVVFLCVFALS